MGLKKYFKNQWQASMLKLEHQSASDFYLSCWQKNRAVLPLLCVRAVIFLGCLAIVLASVLITALVTEEYGASMTLDKWFIYMTHWHLVVNIFTAGFALAISYRAYHRGPIEASFKLPWYVKTYWVLYNIAIPVSIFITIFYYAFLAGLDEIFALDPVLDVFMHLVNSLLMLCLLLTARHPCHLLHFFHPLCFSLVYLIFSGIYYAAGGIDPMGNPYIYPQLDWSNPGLAIVVALACAALLIVLHFFVVVLTAARDSLTRRIRRDSQKMKLEHHSASDFYLSCWQKNRAVFPLLCVRALIFLGCIAIVVTSLAVTALADEPGRESGVGNWFIFMTHWNLIVMIFASGFAFATSCTTYFKGPSEASFKLPWYVKTYWVLYNIAIPVSIFITIFYYALLAGLEEIVPLDPVVDLFSHLVNSLLMLCLLLTARHPCHLLHFFHPLCFTLVYLIFSVIYYAAGGTDPMGNPYIYPQLDWSNPGLAIVVALACAALLIVLHLFVVVLTVARDSLTRRIRGDSQIMEVSNKI